MLLLSRFIISGHSMEPTLQQGQNVLVSYIPYLFVKPKIDDMVLIRHEENRFLIKRITKIDGEKYFVGGDNKKDSMDSRRFGWILKKDIAGKVILKAQALVSYV